MKFSKILLVIVLLLSCWQTQFGQSPPNIILVLVDDQGWVGTSVLMDTNEAQSVSDYYQTPRLEQFANKGMTFSQAYAPAPKCSPTRASILSGQTTAKSKFTNTTIQTTSDSVLVEVSSINAIDTALVTFPELLKSLNLGYTTAHYGKWHLGSQGPENNGFDRSDGNTSNSDGDQGGMIQPDPKKIFSITDSGMAFISDAVSAGNPFYLQLSHYAVHDPLETLPSSFASWTDTILHPQGVIHHDSSYASMTYDLDSAFGILLDSIVAMGIDSNTYVIWYSDNGASRGISNNRPLTRGKVFLDEGGIRVPFMVNGPNIPMNSRSDVPIIGYDLYPTVLDWVMGNVNAVPSNVEGGSLKPVLTSGGTGTVNRGNSLIFHSPHYESNSSKDPRSAIIRDNYKLIVNYETGEFRLFHLRDDIRENINLKDSLPLVLNDLCLELRDYFKMVGAEMPSLNPSHPNNPGMAPDADNDGLDDNWEFRELLTVAYDSIADPDGDGLSNGQEFLAGSDPYVFDSLILSRPEVLEGIPVYPNPGSDEIHIEGLESGDRIMVMDMTGKIMVDESEKRRLEVTAFAEGVYFLLITRTDGGIYSQTIQIRR